MIEQTKLIHGSANGTLVKSAAMLEYRGNRIYFLSSPFSLKDEIKAMKGAKWHGFDENPRKIWSVEDCSRNRFQLAYLKGEDVYAWFDREVVKHQYQRPLRAHQRDLADHFLTFHYGIMAAEMGVGKTLAAQEVMERSGIKHWWWLGPKTSLDNIEREFRMWNLDPSVRVELMNYEKLVKLLKEEQQSPFELPQGLIADEASRLKGENAQRTHAVQEAANRIREKYGFGGYVIEMSGTPSPKSPLDWWAVCEIAWPGFLKEGSRKALESRLAVMKLQEVGDSRFNERIDWRDDDRKCDVCGGYEEDEQHGRGHEEYHRYKPSINEVAYLHERLKGLVIVKHKKDCLDLPDKQYRKIVCKPSASMLRAAKAIADSAESAIVGLTLLRELSDGFQYRDGDGDPIKCPHCKGEGQVQDWADSPNGPRRAPAVCPRCNGRKQVPRKVRIAKEVACPKDAALVSLLDECEETGRIVVFAGFTGSVDRIVRLCLGEKWAVVRCDGGQFSVFEPLSDSSGGQKLGVDRPLDYWSDVRNEKVAFVANPESGGMSLTLVESRMAVYWSNSFKPEYRIQSEDRIHRIGMDLNKGCVIVDLLHLPTDERVLAVIRENRKLELMTLGELRDTDWDNWEAA